MKAITAVLSLMIAAIAPPSTASFPAVEKGAADEPDRVLLIVDQGQPDPALVRCLVRWTEPAEIARIMIRGPQPLFVIGADGGEWTAVGQGQRSEETLSLVLGPVREGHEKELVIDLSHARLPASVLIVAEAAKGEITYQSVVHVDAADRGVLVSQSATYRLTYAPPSFEPGGQNRGPARQVGERRPFPSRAQGSILIEPLSSKTMTRAEIFAEYATPVELDDGPWDCDGSNWPTQTWVDITSAPADAVVSGYLIHLDVTHPQMSDLQIAFQQFYGFANFLWNQGSGVDLHRDYTRDYYNQPLDGIGEPVNNLYLVLARDCLAGNVGSLDYWSIRIYYDAPTDIDLVADSLALTPSTVAPDEDVSVTFSGQVAGTGTVGGAFSVGFYLSADNNITTGDVLLAQVTESSANDPGDTFGVTDLAVTIPASTADGNYFVGVIVDDGDAITESNEANNVAWAQVTVFDQTTEIDLVAQDLSLDPSTVAPDGDVSVSYTGDVQGTGTVGSAFSVGFYLSADSTITTGDVLLDQVTESSANDPGDSFGVSGRAITIPSATADGDYFLGVIIDDGDAIAESNEANNVASAPLTVDSGGTGGCVTTSHHMCLNNDRFMVEVSWEDFGGGTGQGTVVPFGSDDSGLFWFFTSSNWEFMVKVLDGCAINNHYWVFAAATTNVGYTLTVTDTATSETVSYTNLVGVSAPAITDASAFATCP